ncbi:sensor histidine kinase [Natrarchaeobius oligotrophus]|uniref:histidine kinase n=1 Tax=Natrarchaeobius chitinivorans TaxID=1679083 RepID=A0A3N6N322_NATCH|nr:histidine kinase N-terminal 7TM domain-containing protein [Natrarchaeobius chitinivorans]RQH03292.1 hypothetical protein EA472_01540 [Natrarchaeobius chitinivorans]
MEWVVSVPVIVVLTSGALALVVALEAIRHRPNPMAWPLAVLLGGAAAWALPYGLSIGATNPESVYLWNRIRYPGTVLVPVAYFVVATTYAGKTEWFSKRVYAALSVVPALTLVAMFTNPLHGYFWRSTTVVRANGASVVAFEPGALFWLNLFYSYALVGAGLAMLAFVFVRSGAIYRKQSALLMIGGVVPLATNVVVNVVTETGSTIDFTTTALTISGGTFAVALFHFDLLDLRPVARDKLVEELDDAVIVVDRTDTVVDVNDVGRRVLDDPEIGDPIADVLPDGSDGSLPETLASGDGEFVVRTEGRTRIYRRRSTTLTDRFDRRTGRIIYFDDVTDLVEREQRISVLNRVLQHNVRNELSLVVGHLDSAAETATEPTAEHIDAARESAMQVVDLSDKARTLERTITASGAREVVSVSTVVRRVLDDVRSTYPDATFEMAVPDEPIRATVASEMLLEATLENLLENAVDHNDSDVPQVAVRIDRTADSVHLSVRDDGSGIPDVERRVLHNLTETPLDHGSGLGLWIAEWTATLSDGRLSISEHDGGGALVTLSVPVAEE